MRLIATFPNARLGQKFSNFLSSIDIANKIEISVNSDWGSHDYGLTTCQVWIREEDDLPEALDWLEKFKENPDSQDFAKVNDTDGVTFIPPPIQSIPQDQVSKESSPPPASEKEKMGVVTLYTLILCTLLFAICNLTAPQVTEIPRNIDPTPVLLSPVAKILFFDWPHTYDILDTIINTYGLESLQNPATILPAERQLITEFQQTPYWHGFYSKIVHHFKDPAVSWNFEAPLFEKIRAGQVWRLFTPCLLHFDILHIFFNMVWLMILGKQIEARLGIPRYIAFIILTGIFSNIAQYLMGGPNFIGFSGVVCAMIVFIWIRQKKAPWEGYLLHPSTMLFITVFIFAILGIQMISFGMEISGMRPFAPGIANTAHLAGGFIGYLLGRTRYFAWK